MEVENNQASSRQWIAKVGAGDMERQCSLDTKTSSRHALSTANLRKLLDVLGLGMLLGVLVSMPYDQLFGLSDTLNVAVQSMISVFAFASLLSYWPTKVTVEQACLL
jgi:hypothetical protein